MPSKSKLAGMLADRLDRLGGALAALHQSVRDRVAEIVCAAVADAVRDTVRAALGPPVQPLPAAPAARGEAYDPWGRPDDWPDEYDTTDAGGQDAWGYPAASPPAPPGPASPGPPRLAAAAVVGLRAAAWWLAASPARRGWVCVVAGLAAGTAAYALGPAALAVVPAVAALTLASRSAEFANLLPA